MAQNMFSVLVIVELTLTLVMSTVAEIPSVPDYFPEVVDDLSKVIWYHAANSHAKLREAIDGSTMMIEADILMGTKEGSDVQVPIMAHPPDTTSDLTAEEFIDNVVHSVVVDRKKKGIKLDFKQYEALVPVLQYLKMREDEIDFPVWLNADILQGPVNATGTPIPATQFISECANYLKTATLSLGWKTRFGQDTFFDLSSDPKEISEGEYTNDHVFEMIDLVESVEAPITFPVRAGIAAQSLAEMERLLAFRPGSTLTLWSPASDPINMTALRRLREEIGKKKIYVDLPFDLETGPQKQPSLDPMHDELTHSRDSSSSTYGFATSSILMTLLICILVLLNYKL